MAKKTKDEVPNPNSVTNRDILQRMNFLYQASALLGTVQIPPKQCDPSIPSTLRGRERKEEMRRRNKLRHSTAPADLARSYVKSMKAIGQKTNTRLDPTVKRTLCKSCNLVLIPGVTELVRVNAWSGSGHAVCYTCMSCQMTRRIPAPPTPSTDASSEATEEDLANPSPTQPTAEDSSTAMDVDTAQLHPGATPDPPTQGKRKRGPRARPPPLFERNVGHVVFRGNERIA